ncbi:MAG: hypothetical protein J5766_04230, partial [Clostridia bacterium]|nr:hypothetical protein [Clostridia bacterium]
DTEFTTGMYLAVLYNHAYSAISQIYSANTELDTSKEGYYRNEKIDGKVFGDYVTEKTLESLKNIVAVEAYMKNNDIALTEEEESNFKENALLLWNTKFTYDDEDNYSLGKYLENNGVAKSTYLSMLRGLQLNDIAFEKMYGAEGKKAITEDEIKAYFNEHYLVVNEISTTTYSSKTDEEKASIKAKYEECEANVNSGKMTFEAAYAELSALESTDDETGSTESATPNDSYLTEDSGDDYTTAKDMANNTAKLIAMDDDAGFRLIYKKDITADTQGATTYDSAIRQALKGEEFQNELDAILKKMKTKKYDSALSAVKVDKILFEKYCEVYQMSINAISGTYYQ